MHTPSLARPRRDAGNGAHAGPLGGQQGGRHKGRGKYPTNQRNRLASCLVTSAEQRSVARRAHHMAACGLCKTTKCRFHSGDRDDKKKPRMRFPSFLETFDLSTTTNVNEMPILSKQSAFELAANSPPVPGRSRRGIHRLNLSRR